MIDGHGPTRAKRRPEAPGDGSHSCAASGPGLKRRRPTSLIRDIRDRASGGNQINEASHHQGTTPRDRTRRHPPDQPGCSCNPRPPVRSTPEVPYMKQEFADVAWRQPARLRNRIVHGYWSIDLDVVHATAQEQLPGFTADLRRVLAALADQDDGGPG